MKSSPAPGRNESFDLDIIRAVLANPEPHSSAIVRDLRAKKGNAPDVTYVRFVRRIVRTVLQEQRKV